MKERQITVMIKEPGEKPQLEILFDNELEAFQRTVGGHLVGAVQSGYWAYPVYHLNMDRIRAFADGNGG